MKIIGHLYTYPSRNSIQKTVLIMKISIVLLFAFSIQSFGKAHSQTKVTLSLQNVTLSKAFSEIEKKTTFKFLYLDNIVPENQIVSVNVKDATIENVLNIILVNTPLSYKISDKNLIVLSSSTPQITIAEEVKGTVKDGNGEPLVGATVTEKGTRNVTITDANGNFSISVASSSRIIITSVGYESQEVTVTGKELSITLKKAAFSMEEVIVNVGYGTQKKSVTTGAISKVSAKDIENVPSGRIEQALQGRVAGVVIASNSGQPGSSSTIRVRGITTFGDGGNNPLWVVDGVVVDAGGIGFINQSDIESIEVLKDATSAAIYGTRAATGVIMVTTKKGKSGKLNISYNVFVGTSAPAKKLDLLNAKEYATLINEKSVAGGGGIIVANPNSLGEGTNWQDAIFNNNAKRYSHELSVSGGTDRSTFYLSVGLQNQQGIVGTDISKFNRKSIRLNSTHKLSKIFTFGQTVGYAYQKESGIGNTNSEFGGLLSSAINLDPTTPLIITDPTVANAAPYSVNPVIRDANGRPYGISSIVGQEMTNPLAYIQTRLGAYGWSDNIVGNTYLEATITKEIKIKSVVGAKLSYYGGQGFTPVHYLSATSKAAQNSLGKSTNKGFNWNVENTVTYSKKINNHNFTVLAGQGAYVENIGGGSGVTLFNLPVNNYKDASFNFNIPLTDRNSYAFDFVEHKLSSLFARVNYNYDERYLFTGILRRDGSSRFGPNNKYANFTSFSAGWVASKESFWRNNKYINQLKIRGGYGTVGNDNIRDFGYLALVSGGYNYTIGNAGGIVTGYAPLSLDNPDLKWEQTSQLNIGFEARVLNSFNITFDYFNKKTTGILREINIPGYVGVLSKPVGNVADMENSGIEIELNYRKRIGQVNFSANGNFATLKNKVTYVAPDANFLFGDAAFQSMGGGVTRTEVGQSYNSFYGFKTAGIFQNIGEINAYKNKTGDLIQPNAKPGDFRWTDTDGDGVISDKDKQFLGNSIPKNTFGLTLNADYKGFDMMVFAQGAAGNKIFQGLRRLDIGNANYQTKALGRWVGEGSSNDYPRLTGNDANGNFGNMSDFYLESGNYVRLKLIQLGYTIPNNKIFNKIGASRLRVYVTGENPFTITKYTGYDPEIGGGVFGIDKGYYPQARSFIVGAQLQF
jgi:TonB-dependent starch-binding outer membrane protein SusC